LGEIENQLLKHDEIKEVVVVDKSNTPGDKYLCAYIVPYSSHLLHSPLFTISKELKKFLSPSLPSYMIPSYFTLIEKIPLTANGKINRRVLPEPQLKTGENYIGPTNKTEEILVKIWTDVLELSRDLTGIGTNDDFFELGGHSLKATLLASRIQKELDVIVPLVEIFQRPTIKEQARYITEIENTGKKRAEIPDENLVMLREVSSHAHHLFFVHDGSGEVEGYIEFCQLLQVELNCWGIRANRPEHIFHENFTIEELARKYIEKIKKAQARGPYYICGWSLGGTIAFEMVRQLEQEKLEVAFLALIDTMPPKENVSKKSKVSHDPGPELVVENIDRESLRKLIPRGMAKIIPGYEQLGTRQLYYYFKRIRALSHARSHYHPGKKIKIKAGIHFFKANETKALKEELWSGYFKKPVKFYKVRGDHYSIFREPHVRALAGIFDRLLGEK
jgi:thioesterase domain-containing protein/acyl carrier protein